MKSATQKSSLRTILKDWAPTAASIIVIVGALLGGVLYLIRTENASLATRFDGLQQRMEKAEKASDATNVRIDGLVTKALERVYPASNGKETKAQIKEKLETAAELIEFARQNDIVLDSAIISRYGVQALRTASQSPSSDVALSTVAWSVASSFLRYHSALTKAPIVQSKQNPALPTIAGIRGLGPIPLNVSFEIDAFSSDQTDWAIYQPIGKPLAVGQENAPSRVALLGQNATIELDNFRFKNITFYKLHIVYRGGPVILENVHFVDCTFEIPKSPVGVAFGSQILASAATNFHTWGTG